MYIYICICIYIYIYIYIYICIYIYIYMCVCVCVCMCVYLRPYTVKASSIWISWDTRVQINDVVLIPLPVPFIAT